MYQIQMLDENILVKKVEAEAKSEFETGGSTDKNGAIYQVTHAPAESSFNVDELVLLHPGTYERLYLEGELLTSITESDIIAKVTEAKA